MQFCRVSLSVDSYYSLDNVVSYQGESTLQEFRKITRTNGDLSEPHWQRELFSRWCTKILVAPLTCFIRIDLLRGDASSLCTFHLTISVHKFMFLGKFSSIIFHYYKTTDSILYVKSRLVRTSEPIVKFRISCHAFVQWKQSIHLFIFQRTRRKPFFVEYIL